MSEPAIKLVPPKAESKSFIQLNHDFIFKMGLLSIGCFVAGLATTLSYKWFIYSKSHIETNNAYVEADIYNVQSRMMGYVNAVKVEEDQKVEKNDVLIQMDETDVNVEKGFKEAKLKKTQADFERAKSLVRSKLISQSDFELAEAALIAAKADYRGSELKLKYTSVVSPAKGVVGKTYIKPGQFIQPGQNLVTVISKEKTWVKANYKETQIEKIHVGQSVDIEVDAYPGVQFHGHVEGIYPSSGSVLSLLPPENATGNFTKVVQRVPVKISIDPNPQYELRPGMSVLTTINLTPATE